MKYSRGFAILIFRLDDPLAPVAKLTDALNRVRSGDRVSGPSVCGKAFFSIRNEKYSAALESLVDIEEQEGKQKFA